MTNHQRNDTRGPIVDDLTNAGQMIRGIRYGRRVAMLDELTARAHEHGVYS